MIPLGSVGITTLASCEHGLIVWQAQPSWEQTYMIKQYANPMLCRVVKEVGVKKELEEAVFTLQGVLVEKELPPLKERPRYVMLTWVCFILSHFQDPSGEIQVPSTRSIDCGFCYTHLCKGHFFCSRYLGEVWLTICRWDTAFVGHITSGPWRGGVPRCCKSLF